MFAPAVEEETSPGFDDRTKIARLQNLAYIAQLHRQIGIKRIEGVIIERDGDALITEVGEDVERILQRMMRKAVGVVAEEHAARPSLEGTFSQAADSAIRRASRMSLVNCSTNS